MFAPQMPPLPINEKTYKTYKEKEVGVKELVGEPEIPLFERMWARRTLEVHGIRGGFTGAGAKTGIPARAGATVRRRLGAGQRPDCALTGCRATGHAEAVQRGP